ncbi:LuxR C-terminal-related transcriptional regulator [Arthrobacter sp. CAN_C5]|uniref:LuxR C-terminal-related transcriptional regulator n=1 Tax=Arthrobacter sp. CAN_C5 TaxID=2760706 RepID=UPI001FD8775E|nr:LuxR C-terminal-related transcriptional regulator [Arthrobacter sp. CAN_C5]MBP2217124.1 LuxR family maltose regulon positive regulatory protein [Arthrobacter sp. CAN_C5]
MATPVLATKLFIPLPRTPAVARPRLIERLQLSVESHCKLTLICAPAGFGKTTLLSAWIDHLRQRDPEAGVGWLSLDEDDSDLSRFMTYLVAALQRAHPGVGRDLATVVPVEAILTTLLNELAESPNSIILVLDDFQSIEITNIRDALIFLLNHLPANMRVVVASRSDPALPLARLRSRDELMELRAADLRFAGDEVASFLTEVMGLALSAGDIEALETRTEGWIAGLQLAALSMRERSDIAGFIEAFAGSHRFVIDYLGEEVLQRQPEHVRDFLLHTAFLDRLSGPLCQAVSGREDSSELLEALERDNLFVVPLDDKREWYRYHHLFADVLRARSLREDQDRVFTLHRLASDWHDRNALPEDAVRHSLAAGDFEVAANLIRSVLPDMRRRRQDMTLLGWLKQLPDEITSRMPVLSVFTAHSLLVSGDLEGVDRWLSYAERALSALAEAEAQDHASLGNEDLRNLPVTVAVYRASLAQARGDVNETEMQSRRALKLALPGDHIGRGSAAGLLGLALWAKGDLRTAVTTFADARASLQLAGHTADYLGSTVVMADMLIVQGRRDDARRAYEHALQLAIAEREPAAGDLHVGLGELCLDDGELAAANQHLDASKAMGATAALPESRHRWFTAMARIREAEGDPDAALELLTEAERCYLPGFLPEVRPIGAMRARIAIAQGRLADAWEWAEAHDVSATDDVTYLREYEHATLVRLLIAQHATNATASAHGEAAALLQRLLTAAEEAGRWGSVHEILRLRDLFPASAQQGDASGRFDRYRDASVPSLIPPPDASAKTEALSERELHVLRLLATQLSGPEIARELFVSLNTLRTHTKHIFSKLTVNSRLAAVHRAQEQGLL